MKNSNWSEIDSCGSEGSDRDESPILPSEWIDARLEAYGEAFLANVGGSSRGCNAKKQRQEKERPTKKRRMSLEKESPEESCASFEAEEQQDLEGSDLEVLDSEASHSEASEQASKGNDDKEKNGPVVPIVVHHDRNYAIPDFRVSKKQPKSAQKTQPAGALQHDPSAPLDPFRSSKRKARTLVQQVEQYAASQLQSRERRNYLLRRVDQAIGRPLFAGNPMRSKEHSEKPEKRPRVPLPMAMQMLSKARERAQKQKQELRETGEKVVVSSSQSDTILQRMMQQKNGGNGGGRKHLETVLFPGMNHPLKASIERNQRTHLMKKLQGHDRRADRGLSMGIGKFEKGALRISRKERERVVSEETLSRNGSQLRKRVGEAFPFTSASAGGGSGKSKKKHGKNKKTKGKRR